MGRKTNNSLIAVAMSGGVDSSLAAALLIQRGFKVIGLTMKLFCFQGQQHPKACGSLDSIESARRVAAQLMIPHYVVDCRREFQRSVIDYFIDEYRQGRTPNPCVECNRYIKFGLLLQKAVSLGCDRLATGHYARLAKRQGRLLIAEASDKDKDQSYFLWPLKQEQLRRVVFPLGHLDKQKVRHLARIWGLAAADRQESQEICFISGNDYRKFVQEYLKPVPGEIVDARGQVLGQHGGIVHYTIGQRQGLGLAAKHPLYVLRIDAADNRIVVGPDGDLWRTRMRLRKVNWMRTAPTGSFRAWVRVRHRHPLAEARIRPQGNGAEVDFCNPQRAMAPGQSAVFYKNGLVCGGGIIWEVR